MTQPLEQTAPAPIACNCGLGVLMCKTCPCTVTPDEARWLYNRGYGDRLMLNWIGDQQQPDAVFLMCAVKGFCGQIAPEQFHSSCTFLDGRDRCELHSKGLKPLEGATACCQRPNAAASELHDRITQLWMQPENQAFLERWKTKYLDIR
jgi:hypothetical protein